MTKARDLANIISGSGTLNANVIPALPASKITSGTFADARLSSSSVTQHVDLTSLSASNLTSGTVPSARLSLSASDIASGTFDDARLSASSVTQHVDLSNLNASNLTSGTVPNARYGTPTFSAANLTALNASQLSSGSIPDSLFSTIPASAVTQHVSAVTQATGTWSPYITVAGVHNVNATYSRTGNIVQCVANGQWASRPHHSNHNYVDITGLPITSRSGSFRSVGMGFFGSYYSSGSYGLVVVQPGSTTARIYSSNANIGTSRAFTIGGSASETLGGVIGVGSSSHWYQGYRLIARNLHQTAYYDAFWNMHFTYQV